MYNPHFKKCYSVLGQFYANNNAKIKVRNIVKETIEIKNSWPHLMKWNPNNTTIRKYLFKIFQKKLISFFFIK